MIKGLVLITLLGFAMLVMAGQIAVTELAWAGLALYLIGAVGAMALKASGR
jgi:hypothetical protein